MISKKNKKSILIIDPDINVRDLVKEALSQHPVSIIEADHGGAAEKKTQHQSFDLVIMDLALPRLDGKQLLQFFEKNHPKFQPKCILIISEKPINSIKNLSYSAGPIHYLKKPCSTEDLQEKINKIFIESLGKENQKITLEVFNTFIQATTHVFNIMTSLSIKKDNVFLRGLDQMSGDISALLPIEGTQIAGSMGIAFEEKCFLYTATKMLKEPIENITPEVSETAGELGNQIFGIAKKELNTLNHQIRSAFPSMVMGKNHQIQHLINAPIYCIRFNTEQGFFNLELSIDWITPNSLKK